MRGWNGLHNNILKHSTNTEWRSDVNAETTLPMYECSVVAAAAAAVEKLKERNTQIVPLPFRTSVSFSTILGLVPPA